MGVDRSVGGVRGRRAGVGVWAGAAGTGRRREAGEAVRVGGRV